MKMISEEVIIGRDTAEAIANALTEMLESDEFYQFKLRISKDENGKQKLAIIPHSKECEIALD